MNDFSGLYNIRTGKESDIGLIVSTMLKGLHHGNTFFGLIPTQVFMSAYHPVVLALVKQSDIRIACLPDDNDVILGYSMFSKDGTTLHYAFVKTAWRKKGIGRTLCKNLKVFTHFTDLGLSLAKTKLPESTFNPFKV